ncbi:MAG: Zn-ribbon domain-containing OB-fold protein [Rhodobacteraceae bacterium]|nr:Zn-ribbon domain-containing OB-fold protein [Paracoccaceae bacterium]
MTNDVQQMTGKRAYPPRKSEFTQVFWDGVAQGRFRTTKCGKCERTSFPPKPICPHCWSDQVSWTDLSGHGVLYSATTVHAGPAAFAADLPYRVGIVDLDEGMRVATRILDDTKLDEPVELVALAYEDGPLYGARRAPADK